MDIFSKIEKAECPEDVFGPLASVDDLKRVFRALSREVHPDLHGGKPRATDAFAKLSALHETAERRFAARIYGTSASSPPVTPSGPVVIERKGRSYVISGLLVRGDKCDVHRAIFEEDGHTREVVLKIAREATDNDLLMSEGKVLKEMWPPADSDGKGIRYTSRLVDSFRLPDKMLGPRQVIVLKFIADAWTLEEVKAAYPAGVCMEDAVWMFNRMTEGLGFSHRAGYCHGAVLPCHVMVRPKDHGGKLIDWSYAVMVGERISAISSSWESFYAPEIFDKKPVSPSTDVYMAAKCIQYVLGGSGDHVPVPRPDDGTKTRAAQQFSAFLKTCLVERQSARVDDAWAVRKSVDDFMERLFGPKKFHEFTMPPRAA